MVKSAGQAPSRDAWNHAIERVGGDLLQSWNWGDFKQRHGWSAERVMLEDSSGIALVQVLVRHRGPYSLAYIPRGPILECDEALGLQLLDQIDALCALPRHRADHRARSSATPRLGGAWPGIRARGGIDPDAANRDCQSRQ